MLSNAKINLSLAITGRQINGYHELLSLNVPIDIYDKITINESDNWSLSCNQSELLENNIIEKVIEFLKPLTNKKYHIDLQKHIPIMAGFGGGSSDAVAVLKEINKQADLGITDSELCKISKTFGADCPFFVYNKLAVVSGIGDVIQPLDEKFCKNLSRYYFVIFKPPFEVSTKEAYQKLRTQYQNLYIPYDKAKLMLNQLIDSINDGNEKLPVFNTFENLLFPDHKELNLLKEKLNDIHVQMMLSGSGSGCFCITKSLLKVSQVQEIVQSFFQKEIFLQSAHILL